jgi:hypothetical protein
LAVRVVQRYHQTGWSDGLENFAFVGALAITAAFAWAARAGADSGDRRMHGYAPRKTPEVRPMEGDPFA